MTAELSKILTLRGTWIVTGVILALHVLITVANLGNNAEAVATVTPGGLIEIFAGEWQPAEPALIEQLVAATLQMGLFLPVLGAVLAGSEFRAGQLRVSLLAVPRRFALVGAKIAAIGGYLCGVALVVAGISAAGLYSAVRDRFPGLLTSPEALRGQAAVLAFAVLSALVGAALTLILGSTLRGVLAVMALTVATMTQALPPGFDALFPLSAGRNLLLDPEQVSLSAGPEHAMVVLVAWPLLTSAAAAFTLARRDAR